MKLKTKETYNIIEGEKDAMLTHWKEHFVYKVNINHWAESQSYITITCGQNEK